MKYQNETELYNEILSLWNGHKQRLNIQWNKIREYTEKIFKPPVPLNNNLSLLWNRVNKLESQYINLVEEKDSYNWGLMSILTVAIDNSDDMVLRSTCESFIKNNLLMRLENSKQAEVSLVETIREIRELITKV